MSELSVKEAAEKWGLSSQMVRYYCRNGRIPSAYQTVQGWMIPESAERPDKATTNEEEIIPLLARKLRNQKSKKNYHGLYDYTQIYLTYCSSRMASNRLSKDQVELIYRKGKVISKFEPVKVSDCVEVLNHFVCIDYILENVMAPLTQRFFQKLHYILMFGTVDERRGRVTPGEYRSPTVKRAGRALIPSQNIPAALRAAIEDYESIEDINLNDILNFHVEFERVFPFQDGNGRIGRLIMFKECLRHSIMPFVLDDKRRGRYLDGIEKWGSRRKVLTTVVEEAQSRFEHQIELHALHQHGQNFLPEGYEDFE